MDLDSRWILDAKVSKLRNADHSDPRDMFTPQTTAKSQRRRRKVAFGWDWYEVTWDIAALQWKSQVGLEQYGKIMDKCRCSLIFIDVHGCSWISTAMSPFLSSGFRGASRSTHSCCTIDLWLVSEYVNHQLSFLPNIWPWANPESHGGSTCQEANDNALLLSSISLPFQQNFQQRCTSHQQNESHLLYKSWF